MFALSFCNVCVFHHMDVFCKASISTFPIFSVKLQNCLQVNIGYYAALVGSGGKTLCFHGLSQSKKKIIKTYHGQVIVICTLPLIPLKYIIIRQFLS